MAMTRALLLLEHLFMVWMLYDCFRRRPGGYWVWIIFVPFGEWFYFFHFKIHDPEMQWLKELFRFRRPDSLDKLRYLHDQTPSLTNRLRLAQGLHDTGEFDDSARMFEELLREDDQNLEALYGLARCQVGLSELEAAVASFERVIEVDRSFSDYEPWLDLARTLWRLDRKREAIDRLDLLVDTSPRLAHSVTLAQFQKEADEKESARGTLETALHHFRHTPPYHRKRNRMWAFRARRLLKSLG